MDQEWWKLVKKVVSGYSQLHHPSDGPEETIIPLFAHRAISPVSMNESYFQSYFGNSYMYSAKKAAKLKFEYLMVGIKDRIKNKNYYTAKFVISESGAKIFKPMTDEKSFSEAQITDFKWYSSMPSRMFDLKDKHKAVLLFSGEGMPASEFKRTLVQWTKEQ